MKTENGKGNRTSILSELERGLNVRRKMCRKLKRKYKLNKENIKKGEGNSKTENAT